MPLALFRFLPVGLIVAVLVISQAGAQQPKNMEKAVDADHAAKMAKGTDLFKNSVRGVFVQKCVKCHSGDKVESEFDMGTRAALLKGGTAGPAVVPGDHKKSYLYQLIAHQKAPNMPHERPRMPEAEIAKIAEWIDLGAPYDKPLLGKDDERAWTRKEIAPEAKKHWAFQPLSVQTRNSRPETRTAIDGLLQAKLEAAGLKPNPPADRRILIRRVYLDLIGLPPTPEQVDAFMKDNSPDAYQKVVDHLLASPHFGERQARPWLDLVRFAESHGFEHDSDRPTAYHYRDFVIKALNQDLPFDTFARWQLAGDELAPNEPLALMATGYLAAGVHSTQITINEAERHRYDELDDMLANIGTTFLGLTVGCARCHDHKFDPVPSRDYYRMLSTFTTTVRTEVEVDLDPAKYRMAKAAFDAEHKPFASAVKEYEAKQLPGKLAAWEQARRDLPPLPWILPEIGTMTSQGGATLAKQPDGSVLVSGKNPTTDNIRFTLTTNEVNLKSLRIEALANPSLVRGGPGRATNGNFALSNIQFLVAPKEKNDQAEKVKLKDARTTFEQKGLPVSAAIDDNATSAWAIDPQFGKDHAAAFALEKPVGFPGGTIITVTLGFHNNTGHGMGRPRISLSKEEKPELTAPAVPEAVGVSLATPRGARSAAQTAALLKWFGPRDAEWAKLAKAEADHQAKAPKPNVVKALISSEGLPAVRLHTQGDDFLKATHFLRRGDPNQKEGVANVSFLQVLMPGSDGQKKWLIPPSKGSRTSFQRSAFANWLTDPKDGAGQLAARVIVNRLWQRHLGRGLVATVSDFGLRGDRPSHPQLLDFMAGELVKNGWKLKPIHKLIVTSDAYKQSSACTEAQAKADPENKLVGRYPMRRLEAEVIRDSILSVGGILDTAMYGPGTLDEASKKRSIYFTMKRSKLIPSLIVFDAPDGTAGVGERPSTTIAPQALHLMNNPQVRAAAKGFAKRILGKGTISDADAVKTAYLAALCREPTADELAQASVFLKGQTGAAREASFADFCQVLFCLNEFLYVE
jgi:hypothetical protein